VKNIGRRGAHVERSLFKKWRGGEGAKSKRKIEFRARLQKVQKLNQRGHGGLRWRSHTWGAVIVKRNPARQGQDAVRYEKGVLPEDPRELI